MRAADLLPRDEVDRLVSHPKCVVDVREDGTQIIHIPEGPRVQDLLEANNATLEKYRSEKRSHARTREEVDVWKERALTYRSAIRRIDPVWLGEEG